MKLLVIGREGQLARSLAERGAADRRIEMTIAGRPDVDLERPGAATALIRALSPDCIINSAAYTAVDEAEDQPERAFAINERGAGEVAEAAARAGSRLIHLSTDYVFDGEGTDARSEAAPTEPLGVYGRSKLAGEVAVRSVCSDALIVRTAWVFSPFGRNFVRTMMDAARDRDTLQVVNDQYGNPTSALDLADGLLVAATSVKEDGGLLHLAGRGAATWAEFALAIMEECRSLGLPSARIEPITSDQWPTRAQRPRNSMLDSSRFESEFGFTMPYWRDSLPAVVARLAGHP